MDTDIDTYDEAVHVSWIDILAYLAAKYGGDFSNYSNDDMDDFIENVKKGRSVATITKNM